MSVELKIKDESSNGNILSESVVQFPVEQITVKELIEARVDQEVASYNMTTKGDFVGLVQPCESEILLNRFRLPPGQKVNTAQQQQVAIKAFQSNKFFILVNDKQLTELDEVILITPNTRVSFLKLVPLIGG